MTAPTPLPRSSVMTGIRVQDDAAKLTQKSGCKPAVVGVGKGAMVDSYLSSFNSVGFTSPRVEDYNEDDEVFEYNVAPSSNPFTAKTKGPAPPVPITVSSQLSGSQSKNRPPLQRLEELPGLSIMTWEEFVEQPSLFCGLFHTDREDFIHYNPEQVNVFFHDSRMDQPTLGSPSGDGLSWTIFIDNYNHLRSVRTWLTERVSIILLSLLRPKGKGRAACLVAINPLNQSVGAELGSSFSRAIEAFLHHRNFSIEINLNSCVRTWCRTVLQMPCGVRGGRLVVTNADECVPCCRVVNVPFCVLCFPVWAIQKLSYKFKRRSQYEDLFLYFKAEDLILCTKSPKLKQYAENNNNRTTNSHLNQQGQTKGARKETPWIKKNRQAVTAATQTLDSDDRRGQLAVEEVENEPCEEEEIESRKSSQTREVQRVKHSNKSSASSNTDRFEPQLSNGFPTYRPALPPNVQNKEMPADDSDQTMAGSKNNLLSVSTMSSSYSLATADHNTLSSIEPTPREGAHVVPVTAVSWRRLPGDNDSLDLQTPRTPLTPRSPREDPRAAGLDPMSTMPSVGSDDEYGNYRLLANTPSPRPDTPFHKSLPPQSLKLTRPQMAQETIVDESVEHEDKRPPGDRMQLKGGTVDIPSEPGNKQRKKRISKVLRDIAGNTSQHTDSRLPPKGNGLYGRDNQAFVKDEASDSSFKQLKNISKVKYTPIKGLKEKNAGQAFPYTSELLDFVGENAKNKTSYSPAHQASKGGEDGKKPTKKKSAVQKKAENMLFAPRFKLGDDKQDRNCLSDNDIVEDEFGDMEPDSVMSDVEGVASPRLIPVKKTERTISVNSLQTPKSETETDWEITDCELDDDSKRQGGPKILAGFKGAQQLRAASAHRSRESSASHSGDSRRRGGVQNDSRRRYIALNSLRRKANQLALQAELRKQRQQRPDSSASSRMELMEV